MKRLERLTAILTFLQGRRYTNINDLCTRFDVTARTIFRDMKSLKESGVPIAFADSKGYFVADGYYLAPLALTIEEARSFIFVEQLANKYIDQATRTHLNSAMEKIRTRLRDHQLEDLAELEEKVLAYVNPKFTPKLLDAAQEACAKKQVLLIEYANFQGVESERIIEPIGITFYSQQWHLIAYCRLRSDYRDFVLTRINKLEKLPENFSRAHLTLIEYIDLLQSREKKESEM